MPVITATRNIGTLPGGILALEEPAISQDPAGWDTVRQKWLVESTVTQLAATLNAVLPRGATHPDLTQFRLATREIGEGSGDWWEVECTYHGFLHPGEYKRSLDSLLEEGRGEILLSSTNGEARYATARPMATTVYVSTTEPDLTKLNLRVDNDNPLPSGYPALPSAGPTSSSSLSVTKNDAAGSSTPGTLTFLKGWRLEKRELDEVRDELNTVVLWLVTDVHVYREWTEFEAD